MTVRVNKSAFNIREKLSELERPIGVKGNELMRAETTQDARDLVSAGRRNLIINGDMRVAQRGTSGTKNLDGYGGYLCVDRWASYYDDTQMEQVTRTVDGQLKYALKVTAAATNGRAYVYQKIEYGSRILGDGKPFSVSFWARASESEKRQVHWRYYDSATENNPVIVDIAVIDLTTEWRHYKLENISIVDTSQNYTRDGGLWLYNDTGTDIGTGFWIEITDVQVELGKQCTEFEHRSYGEELALCQRYYEKCFLYGLITTYIAGGYNYHNGSYTFQVEKRVPPSQGVSNASVGNYQPGGGTGTASISNSTTTGLKFLSGSTSTTFPDQWINTSTTYLGADAEL